MVKECGIFDHSQILLEKMTPGVFLTSAAGGKRNTMIIGWGGIQVVWNRPLMVVYVRHIRATHELIEKSGQFTISVPTEKDLSAEIKTCGTRSMRDIGDKFAYCKLTPVPGRRVDVPIIGECGLHYECRVLLKQELQSEAIPDFVKKRFYPKEAYHTVYYADIVDTYLYDGGR
ncbi:MAG TPA: flavin reductase family protein [Candidatus Izemoplasmatales bacterium]|nr:flavin reductase family protein [Bacillota bacterium]HRY77466.1 flavin reductase family protein [Candidatus Izemoplasmatales bacterium]